MHRFIKRRPLWTCFLIWKTRDLDLFSKILWFFFISIWLKNNKGLCLKVYKILQVIINLEYVLLNINLCTGETHHWLPVAMFSPLFLCLFKTHGAAWLRGTLHLNQGHWRNHCLSLELAVVDAIIDSGILPVLRWPKGEGNGNPLQYSCLENPMDRGAW